MGILGPLEPAVTQAKVERAIGHGTRELLVQALAFVSQMTVERVRGSDTLDAITAVLDAHQRAPMFDRVVSGDNLPIKKPDPAGIRSCLAQFHVPAARALLVGDSSIDVANLRKRRVATAS